MDTLESRPTSTDAPAGPRDDDRRRVAPALTSRSGFGRGPLDPATWRAVSHASIGLPFLFTAGVMLLVLVPLGVVLAPLLGVGVPVLLVVLVAARAFARLERARLRAQLGVSIEGAAPRPRRSLRSWPGLWSALTDAPAWSAVLYAVLAAVLATVQLAVAWSLGAVVALVASPLVAWDGGPSRGQARLVALSLAGPWLWAAACQGLALLHVRLARGLLVRSTTAVERAEAAASAARKDAERAQQRAEHLDETRTRAVGAADDDRRRIERDLHDGAQQRLVALGVELGTARRAAGSDPAVATAALEHAHREVKETLAELRDLVRGIHPAVLTDRGLDAALSAIAARHPVPVTVDVPDAEGLAAASPGAQAAAYFVTAEALTNSARHAAATHVLVRAEVVAGRLRLDVGDDGRGGALAVPGGGLDGLRSRVEALDGTFRLDSTADRGTRITVEVPCTS